MFIYFVLSGVARLSGVASMMPQYAQPTPSIYSSSSSQPKETVEEPVSELDSKVAYEIKMICKNTLLEYELLHNLGVCI